MWVPWVFTKNRERLLEAEVAHKFLAELLNHKEVRGLLSDEHFSVDGTQVAAWLGGRLLPAPHHSGIRETRLCCVIIPRGQASPDLRIV